MIKANPRNIPFFLWEEWEKVRLFLLSLDVDLDRIKIAIDESK